MSYLLKFIIAKIISIFILLIIINGLFFVYFSEIFSLNYFVLTLVLINGFVMVDKIFQPLLLIGREKKDFKQALFLILFLFMNPFLFAFPYLEYMTISEVIFPEQLTTILWFLGTLMLIIGGITMCTARLFLGKNGFLIITMEKDSQLITGGPYRFIRHPIYAGIILLFIGYTISFASVISIIIITGFFSVWFRKRIKLEEQLLIQAYGDEYTQYMKHTKKILPFMY